MNLLRPILAVAVIALAIVFSGRFSEQHTSEDPFQQLYLHLMPARLVHHHEAPEATGHEEAAGEHAGEAEDEHAEDHPVAESLITLPAS